MVIFENILGLNENNLSQKELEFSIRDAYKKFVPACMALLNGATAVHGIDKARQIIYSNYVKPYCDWIHEIEKLIDVYEDKIVDNLMAEGDPTELESLRQTRFNLNFESITAWMELMELGFDDKPLGDMGEEYFYDLIKDMKPYATV